MKPDRFFGPWVELPARDIAPGDSVKLTQQLWTPSAAGTYTLHFDLVENHRTWFAHQGSPVPTLELIVTATVPQ